MAYSPASFLVAYLTASMEDVGVEVIWTISDGRMSFPALDQLDFGRLAKNANGTQNDGISCFNC